MYYTNDGFDGFLKNPSVIDVDFSNNKSDYANLVYSIPIDLENLGKVAQRVYEKPKIAHYEYVIENECLPFFVDKKNTKESIYIIGDPESLSELESNLQEGVFEILNNKKQIKNISKQNTMFLFNSADQVNDLNTAIIDLNLDIKSYNFMWTTVENGICLEKLKGDNYSRTEDEDSIRAKEIIITKEHLEMEYKNVLVEYKYLDQKFDFAYKRSINVIAAQTGNLKSTFINNIVQAAVNNNNSMGLKFLDEERQNGDIILFDTETNEKHLAQKWEFYMGCNSRIQYATLKNIPSSLRLKYVNSLILDSIKKGKQIRMVIIDSLIDFIKDFNSIEESHGLVENILQLTETYDIPIFVTYQENPARFAGANNKLSGHLGTMLNQKCESHYQSSVKNDEAKLVCKKNRNEKQHNLIYDLDTTSSFIKLNVKGTVDKKKGSSEKKLDILISNIDTAFHSSSGISNEAMKQWIKEQINVQDRAADSWKQKMIKADIIKKLDDKSKVVTWIKA